MWRPDHLPDFMSPPLDEVVLGVQFTPIPNYSSVNACDIWSLFKNEYPNIQEHPLLEQEFETFGGANLQHRVELHFGLPPLGSRLWFLSKNENHLLQFQPDRFLTNWRKHVNAQEYPRFERIFDAFKSNLDVLSKHFTDNFHYEIDINQAEIAYINIIPVDQFSDLGEWVKLWNAERLNIESLNINFNEVITDAEAKPFARLTHEFQPTYTIDGKRRAFRYSLSFRGKPNGNDIESAMEFFKRGRDIIVTRFGEITTDKAHKFWGKLK